MALLQKRIISRCNQLGKPVLITRLVDTMVDTPRPTRAGVSGLLFTFFCFCSAVCLHFCFLLPGVVAPVLVCCSLLAYLLYIHISNRPQHCMRA